MSTEAFCETFCNALVYDHKEDTSIGGGHDAQWSIGVADMLHGALRNVTQPVDLFPFMRHNQSCVVSKLGHAKLFSCRLWILVKKEAKAIMNLH